jgi:hypothetical protein
VSFYGGACQKRPGAAKTSVGVADRSIFDIRTYMSSAALDIGRIGVAIRGDWGVESLHALCLFCAAVYNDLQMGTVKALANPPAGLAGLSAIATSRILWTCSGTSVNKSCTEAKDVQPCNSQQQRFSV